MIFKFNLLNFLDLFIVQEINDKFISKNILKKIKSLESIDCFISQKYSSLYVYDNYLIKVIKPQKLKDKIRRFFNSQSKREFTSSKELKAIGINVPEIYLYGSNLTLFPIFVESFLVMEFISKSITAKEYIKNSSVEQINIILKMIAKDLSIMHLNNIYHKDLNLNNILIKNNTIYWIDNDIKYIYDKKELKFKSFDKIKKHLTKEEMKSLNNFYESFVKDIK